VHHHDVRRAVRVAQEILAALVVVGLSILPQRSAGAPTPVNGADLAQIAPIVQSEIGLGHVHGAVILVGNRERILYRQAFGQRVIGPDQAAMTADTIFDLASLTKVVATAPAIMQLAERGRLDLDRPAADYWPAFGANGKDRITVRDLLIHYSGLRADLDLSQEWRGYDTAMGMIVAEAPIAPPRTKYLYSDINFEALGRIVERVSGMSLDDYGRKRIFWPLHMIDTGFLPSPALRNRIAPTEDAHGNIHWGDVHDATSRWMGGVAGHAGVFSTADDLSTFARMILGGGEVDGVRVMSRRSVEEMTRQQSPPGGHARALGWELGGPDGYTPFPGGTFGHLGFTGTMIWLDPADDLYAIVLTNRTYPDGTGDAAPLRKAVMSVLTSAIEHSRTRLESK
jgi:CubicO group peptidase (beta-lactamase class C family)